MPEYQLTVVLIEHETLWSAQCLQYDIGAQGATLNDVIYEMQRSIAGYLAICDQLGVESFANLDAAPKRYWDMARSGSSLDASNRPPFRQPAPVPLPFTDYRVAEAVA